MRVVVSIPAFNEETSVGQVVKRVPRRLKAMGEVLVIVVDDGSTDSTADAAKGAGADVVVIHKHNRGVAAAFSTGLNAARKLNADVMVNLDADGQFDPEEIPNLLLPIAMGEADLVLGSRFTGASQFTVPLVKRVGNVLVSFVVSLVAGRWIRDTQCGFRALSRKAMSEVTVTGYFTYTQETIIDLCFKGIKMKEIPVSVHYFGNRQSRIVKSMPKYAMKVLGVVALTVIRNLWKPIMAALTFAGVLALIVSLATG